MRPLLTEKRKNSRNGYAYRQATAPVSEEVLKYTELLGAGRVADGVRMALWLAQHLGLEEDGTPSALKVALAAGYTFEGSYAVRARYTFPELGIPDPENPFG